MFDTKEMKISILKNEMLLVVVIIVWFTIVRWVVRSLGRSFARSAFEVFICNALQLLVHIVYCHS